MHTFKNNILMFPIRSISSETFTLKTFYITYCNKSAYIYKNILMFLMG